MNAFETDEEMTALVNEFAANIEFNTEYPINITVVNENVVNAFAIPGGQIVVFDGLLSKMTCKEELAALLAHEVAHVHHRHSLKSMCKSLAGALFVSLVFGDAEGISSILVENSNALMDLSYSRKLELEADNKGCLLYTSPSPRDLSTSRMPSSA